MSEPPLTPPQPVLSSYLSELEREFSARAGEPVTGADLLMALRAVGQALEEIGRHRQTLKDTVGFVNELQERLVIVDALPADAPFGALIRLRVGTVAQRATLYTGNGVGQPLARLVPQAL